MGNLKNAFKEFYNISVYNFEPKRFTMLRRIKSDSICVKKKKSDFAFKNILALSYT